MQRSLLSQPSAAVDSVLTCNDARSDGGEQRSLCTGVHPGQDPEQEPVLGHGIDDSRHGEHGAQETGRR